MKARHIAVDLDGVIFNFSDAYASLITAHTGIQFPKTCDTWPTCWFWERAAGVTPEQEAKVWKEGILKDDENFWLNLKPMPEACVTATQLNHLQKIGHHVYFISNRAGDRAKIQTERALYNIGIDYPCLLFAADKVPLIRELKIDFFADDRIETVNDVARVAEEENLPVKGHVFLKHALYNKDNRREDVKVVDTVMAALKQEDLWK